MAILIIIVSGLFCVGIYCATKSTEDDKMHEDSRLKRDKMWDEHFERMEKISADHKKFMLELEMICMSARERANIKWNMNK